MEKITMTKKEFMTIAETITTVCKDEVRPILQCINFSGDSVVSLDGYRLKQRKINTVLEGSYNIQSKDFKKIMVGVKEAKPEVIEFIFDYEEISILFDGEKSLSIRNYEANYINYKSLIPVTCEKNVYIHCEELKEAIKPFKGSQTIIFRFKDNLLTIQDQTGAVKNVLGAEFKGQEFTIAFNNKFIKDAIKGCGKYDLLHFGMSSPVAGAKILNGDKLDLVLPVRLVR